MADPQHVTLTADTVATVTLGEDANRVVVLNVTGDAAVYFNINAAGDPDVAADGCWVLPAAIGALEQRVSGAGRTVVKLISDGTPTVMVGVA